MAKVIMVCGKICSGKSTYANGLQLSHKAVILSADEIMLVLFGQEAGDKLDNYVKRAKEYLYNKSLDIIRVGIDVILDWGFWTKRERVLAKEFFTDKNIECEFHYIDINDEEWDRRLEKRNKDVIDKKSDAYFVDSGLAAKFETLFEKPDKKEIDVWIRM